MEAPGHVPSVPSPKSATVGISNVCFHTATGVKVEGIEYVDEFVRDPVKFRYFPE